MRSTAENTPKVYMMVGHAGSGKSYFAKKLSTERGCVRLNSDSMRIALFGSVEAISEQPIEIRREGVFQAVDYAATQVLEAGHDVIYDANNNKRIVRDAKRDLAAFHGAQAVAVWIKTDKATALSRVQNREEDIDQRVFDETKGTEVIDRHIANFDNFGSDETVIEIDGLESFQNQLQSFDYQLGQLNE